MSYKTILVHVEDTAAGGARLDAANRIAAMFDARLICLSMGVQTLPLVVEGSVASAQIWAEEGEEINTAAITAAKRAAAESVRLGINAEARTAKVVTDSAGQNLAIQARYADLTILGMPRATADERIGSRLIDAALFDSGRPALVLPPKGAQDDFGVRGLLAWDGGREAARAAYDALPLLERAKCVQICIAKTWLNADEHGEEPGSDIGRWLASHGVHTEAASIESTGRSVADSLIQMAAGYGADHMVMGGFGHSRLREAIFGGVTADLLNKSELPLFMSH